MRSLSKALVIAVGFLAMGVLSASVSANELAGSFTLSQPTQWKNTTLPAGNYRFRMARTQTDAKILSIHGKKALEIMVYSQSACETCKTGALKLDTQNGNRVVTAMDLPGYHMDFNGRHSAARNEEMLSKAPATSEQIAVHVDPN